MDESKRKYKWGRYGIGKYVYDDEQQQTMRDLFQRAILDKFDGATIEYFT
jgi:spore photoproduct lyase